MKGISLWNEAKKIIPGGNQLLSKRAEMFLPDQWPAYYEKAKGVFVWDLNGRKLVDMSLMGVGACVLGYADETINNAVKNAVDNGSMCTLNCPEEVELAKLMLKYDPWASKVRYARTGGEAMAIAVRIARAHTKRAKVVFCGYHGWHDWYLSVNLNCSEKLNNHLLPGLDPNGVPNNLTGTTFCFNYNKIEELKNIVKENQDIAAIVVEPIRYSEPQNGFLQKVKDVAKEIGAVLIFDEITSGFRMRMGGTFELYNINPDIVVYGKAIANGFPMSVILGNEVMDAAQTSFISSTFWTERIGPTAAIATLKKMEVENVPEHLKKTGRFVKEQWNILAEKHGLDISIKGIDPLATFIIQHPDSQALHTLFTQEMLERGYLASKQVYISFAHSEEIVNNYLETVDEVFALLKKAINDNNVKELLKGPVAHTGFKRLT